MNKQIFTIGFEIPGFGENNISFSDNFSLMDADILLISPNSISPFGDWVSFSAGGGCYNVEPSKRFEERSSHLKKEVSDCLSSGKTVFIILSEKDEFEIATGVSSARKGQHTYSTKTVTNYDFLPINIGMLTSASGKQIKFSGNSLFSFFDKNFRQFMQYELYIENAKSTQILYSGKDSKKILGAIYKVESGNLIVLPMINIDEEEFTETKKDKNGKEKQYWNQKSLAFGKSLVSCLIDIDSKLTSESEKTSAPTWIEESQFAFKREITINKSIYENLDSIKKLERENEKLQSELVEEISLKDLLFEQGKPLENAVIKALTILGYKAENYNDGDLEMDQIIISPENSRYIGECEGKDTKDIDVTKFRQLQDALNADFDREEIEEKAYGILFGNAERMKNPKDRKLDFTTKCKTGAEREKVALIRTVDLFAVAKYLSENNDDVFKKDCRQAIHDQLGKVVVFPKLPAIVRASEK